jgi:hypothetical protein
VTADAYSALSPSNIVAAFSRLGFKVWLLPDGTLVIEDQLWRKAGWRQPREPPPQFMTVFGDHADAIGCLLEEDGAANTLPMPDLWAESVLGLMRFVVGGWAAKAEQAGWTDEELYRMPPLIARVDLTGAALLIGGDHRVVDVTEHSIVIETQSGSRLRFWRAVP